MKFLIAFGQYLFSGIGFLWLFLEAYYSLNPADVQKLGFLPFICLGLVFGCIWFVIDGFAVTGFLKRSIEITSNAFDTQITVLFGDLFAQNGFKVVSVNEFFDSTVDGRHVASNTLHGLMLSRCWPGYIADWDSQIDKDLSRSQKEVVLRPSPGKPNRYEIGTTAHVSRDGNDFLCVAMTKTCIETLKASATSADLQVAMRGLLRKARSVCSGEPLNIPLLGSGLARTGIKPNIIVDLILLAIFEESKMQKVTNHIRIILPKQLQNRVDLTTILKDWR